MARIFSIFHGRFPSEKAAALFAAKGAEAFGNEGSTVTLIVPRRRGVTDTNPFDFYGVARNFKVVYIPTLDLFSIPGIQFISFWLSMGVFSITTFFYLRKHAERGDIIYSNETIPLLFASFFFPNTFYEMHDFPESKKKLFGYFARKVTWILIHNRWKTERAISEFALPSKKILTVPNAVELDKFDIDIGREEARKQLGLPSGKKIVVYTGHLYSWKGTDTLASVAGLMKDVLFVFVGGTEKDISNFKQTFSDGNLLFKGFRPHTEIPLWQKAADVLVIPNTAKEDISKYYTSPMKLFEYMASGTPIVASKIPSIEEVVTENEVFFAEPDNTKSFTEVIAHVFAHPESTSERSIHARAKVEQFTWKIRAKKILSFIGSQGTNNNILVSVRILFILRYIISGVLALATNLVFLFVLKHYFNVWYLAASTIAFIISVIVSFTAQKFITFKDGSNDQTHRQFISFLITALINVCINAGLMFSFVDIFGISYLLSQILSALMLSVWSLGIYSFLIFKKTKAF